MKQILYVLILLLSKMLFCQNSITVYDYNEKDTIMYYIEKDKLYKCPLNKIIEKNKCLIKEEIVSKSNRYEMIRLSIEQKTKITAILPNVTNPEKLTGNYIYDLPYSKGESYKVTQGYNGSFSHQGIFALDFNMPEGSKVLATRDGLVVSVVVKNNKGCASLDCYKFANYITIMHSDATIAKYAHLQKNGAKVKVGDRVKKGDVIGFSGNTGFSSGPHLHFICYLHLASSASLKTFFRTENGEKHEYLQEDYHYPRNY